MESPRQDSVVTRTTSTTRDFVIFELGPVSGSFNKDLSEYGSKHTIWLPQAQWHIDVGTFITVG